MGDSVSSRKYVLPGDSGRKASLGKSIAEICKLPGLLVIEAHGIWPSSENPLLFKLLRFAFGEQRSVDVAPGHIFEVGEEDELSVFLTVVLYFLWDASLIELEGNRVWEFSHDEWFSVRGYPSDLEIVDEYFIRLQSGTDGGAGEK